MIVVDTNVIAYLFLPADNNTRYVERLIETDDHWVAPMLWRSEFRNILALYLRKDIVDFPTALEIQSQAESLMNQNEFSVQYSHVLSLADKSACSAYDCEFVALAQSFSIPLVTADRKLVKAFPDIACSLKNFVDNDR
ncbi:type II toxin-antitoxin system VapC family toxin [Acaryochloris sp. IP29b_bin.148]|uniref:type II toxin-antitoxin system VapC family toxin n=1 Tax=Acaryochloris sp. IP29b_bin.148 TaxID=2969218 RepID=UPI002612D521|nr:type II toxin-antitoxin system VapC family toxin [Acaryochloris sp. IP29b_bin.148]